MEEENRMEKLYEQLRDDLRNHRSPLYYDEADLIDIFDYAGDVRDDYIRLQTLIMGRNLFPDSTELMKRQAVFLSNISNEALRSFVADNRDYDNDPLWQIIATRAMSPMGEEAVEALESIVSRRLEDDETIIQFVSLVRHLQQEQWLIDNLDRIRRQCAYPATLLYEIARLSETNAQNELSIKLLDELTMTDPFNVDYWGLLAELQCNSGKYDQALSSLEYAKALAPDDHELHSLEGFVYLRRGNPSEALKSLQRALEANPDYYPTKRNIIEALKASDADADTIGPLLSDLFLADPSDVQLLTDMLITYPDKAADTLSRHYATSDPDEMSMIHIVGDLSASDHADVALIFIDWYRNNYPISQTGEFAYLELLYINKQYDKAYDFICQRMTSVTLKTHELPVLAIIASTLLRLALYEEVRDFCSTWIERLKHPSVTNGAFRLVNRGLIETLTDISRLLADGHAPTEEEVEATAL